MNTFSHPRFRMGWILLVLGIISSFFWTLYRWNYENHYTQTQITLDIEDTKSLADAYGISQAQLLKDFHERGARSLAVYDQSIATFRDNGRLAIVPRETAEKSYPGNWSSVPASYRYLITSSDSALLEQIYPRIAEQSPKIATLQPRKFEGGILIPASKQLFNDVAVGFDPQQVALARDNGYIVTARVSNSLNLTPARLTQMFDDVKGTGAKVVIFSEDEVLGYDSLISNAARQMRNEGLIFSNIEFSKQRGAADFAKNTEGILVRVHSVQGDEASRTDPDMMVDRFVRAAKERAMRVLYIRLLRQQKGEPVEPLNSLSPIELKQTAYSQNLDFITQVSDGLQAPPIFPISLFRPGLTLAPAQPFGDYPDQQFTAMAGHTGGKIIRFLMLFGAGLGVVGSTLLILNLFYDWSDKARWVWLFLGLFIVAGFSLSAGMGAKLMSLVSGSFVSIVAIMWGGLPLVWDGLKKPEKATPGQIAWFGFKILAKTTLITLAGALLVVALLNNWRYMSKADEFLGEKATQFIPLLLVPFAFLGEIFPHRVIKDGAKPSLALALRRITTALDRPFTAKIALVSLVIMGAGYIWMARFGNESGMTISSFELALRSNLEKLFVTRPRTKEILMGMPAFMLAIALMPRNNKLLALGIVTVAVIGQADVLNSMCHIHTPVFYCIWRSLMGILIGGAVGAVVVIFFEKFIAPRFSFFDTKVVS